MSPCPAWATLAPVCPTCLATTPCTTTTALPTPCRARLITACLLTSTTTSLTGWFRRPLAMKWKNWYYLMLLFSDQPILSRFPSSLAGSNSRSNLQIYSQLQVPSASNFGSMKKKKNGKKNSRSDASSDLSQQLDQNYSQNQVGESSSADASATYVPDFISITNKPVKVWMVVNIPKITGISNGLRVFPSVISKPKLV